MEYTFKTKQMIEVSEKVGNFYDIEKAIYESDLKVLTKLIAIFGNVSEEQAQEEIDKMIDEGKKIPDIYKDIIDGVNKKGFFKQKIQTNLEAPPINTEKLIEAMYEAQLNKQIESVKVMENM